MTENQVPPLIEEILRRRGIEGPERVREFLAPSLKELRNPFELKNMDKAVERLLSARSREERVCVYADFDLDGTSGLALLYEGLRRLGFSNLRYYQPKRLGEGYGVHAEAVDELAADGVKVIVTVDVGISAVEAAARSRELGVDLIITDHHLPPDVLPDADIIVNPNCKECDSKLSHLSGAGVAFYLVLAIRLGLRERGELESDLNPKELLDCFAVGTLTDMVPLREENRVLVKHGLRQLARTRRPGLRKLLEALHLTHESLSSSDVVMQFAPKLNALSRMENGLLPVDLFLAEEPQIVEQMVQEVLLSNELRKRLQKEAEEIAQIQAEKQKHLPFVWVHSEKFHKGVIGLVATKLMLAGNKPAFVGSVNTQTGQISGSSRAPQSATMALTTILNRATECLTKHGGHARAAGFGLDAQNAEAFGRRLAEVFDSSTEEPQQALEELAFTCELKDLGASFLAWYEGLEPFGTEFPIPLLEIQGALLTELRELRGGHLKLRLGKGSEYLEAVYFSPRLEFDLRPGQKVTLLGRLGWNSYQGRRTPQFIVEELARGNA